MEKKNSSTQGQGENDSGDNSLVNDPFQKSLSSTAQAFTHRIQRRIKEKEQSTIVAEEEAKVRHSLLLGTLLHVKKALTDVTRIDLGERFCFSLNADDQNGWPRLTISLIDNVMRAAHYPVMQVTAHDRHQVAIVEIKYNLNKPMEQINLVNEESLSKTLLILKRCVRDYLDTIADLIIEAESNSIEFSDSKNLIDPRSSAILRSFKKEDLDFFQESVEEILETLPETDDISQLKLEEDL